MNEAQSPAPAWEELPEAERQSALFANLVMQQTNAALLMLGQVPHPKTGKTEVDLEGAKLFIDTLEMIEAKTRGQLTKPEAGMLKQSLTMVRLAFVEKVNADGDKAESSPAPEAAPAPAEPPPDPTAAGADSRKKFSKKYD